MSALPPTSKERSTYICILFYLIVFSLVILGTGVTFFEVLSSQLIMPLKAVIVNTGEKNSVHCEVQKQEEKRIYQLHSKKHVNKCSCAFF